MPITEKRFHVEGFCGPDDSIAPRYFVSDIDASHPLYAQIPDWYGLVDGSKDPGGVIALFKCQFRAQETAQALNLRESYGDYGEHPIFTRDNYVGQVAMQPCNAGYWEWVAARIDSCGDEADA